MAFGDFAGTPDGELFQTRAQFAADALQLQQPRCLPGEKLFQ